MQLTAKERSPPCPLCVFNFKPGCKCERARGITCSKWDLFAATKRLDGQHIALAMASGNTFNATPKSAPNNPNLNTSITPTHFLFVPSIGYERRISMHAFCHLFIRDAFIMSNTNSRLSKSHTVFFFVIEYSQKSTSCLFKHTD